MIHFRSRTDLVLYARDNVTSNACRRAFTTGKVTVLGGFDPLPPGTAPGWLLCVCSVHGRTWYIAVVTDDANHCYIVRERRTVPWEHWAGSLADETFSLRNGDMPVQAEAYRRQAWLTK